MPMPCLLLSTNDQTFTVVEVNTAYLTTINPSALPFIGKSVFELYSNGQDAQSINYQDLLKPSLSNVLTTKQTQQTTIQAFWLSNEEKIKTLELEHIPVFDEENEISYIIQAVKVIDAPSVSNLYLEHALELYDAMLNNTLNAFFVSRPDGNIIRANKAACQLYGYTEAEFQQMGRSAIFDTTNAAYVQAIKVRNEKRSVKGEFIGLKKDGSEVLVEIFSQLYLDKDGIEKAITFVNDISERKKLETEMALLINNTEETFILVDKDLIIRAFNKQTEKLYKDYLKRDIKIGDSIKDYAISSKITELEKIYESVLNGNREESTISINTQKNGLLKFSTKYSPARDKDGTIIGVFVTAIDITEQVKLEKKHRQLEADLIALIENTPDIIYSVDLNFGLLTFNSSFERLMQMLGRAKPHRGINVFDLYNPSKGAFYLTIYQKVIQGDRYIFEDVIEVNNEYWYYEVSVNPMFNDSKEVIGVSVFSKNITEKREFEKKNQKTLETLNNIMALSVDIICTINENGEFVSLSSAAQEIWGYMPEELIGKPYIELVLPEDREKTNAVVVELIKGLEISNFENRYIHKNGKVVPIMWSVRWVDADKLFYCTAKNMSEKKEIESKLLESLEKYKYLFENNPAPMFIWDFQTLQIIDCNEEALLMYGYTREEFLNLNIRDIRPEEDIDLINEATQNEEVYGQIHHNIWRHKRKNGELLYVEVAGHLINLGDRRATLVQINDITAKELAIKELKDNEAKLRTASIIAKLGYWQLDINNDKLFWSDEIYNIWGVHKDSFEVSFSAFFASIHPDDQESFWANQALALSGEKELDFEHRIVLADGSIKWVHEKGKLVQDKFGKAVLLEGTVQDITERKNVQIALQERNAFIETALENLPIGIAVNKMDSGTATLMNKKFGEIYGWPIEVLTDIPTFFEKVYPDESYRTEISQRIMADIASGDVNRMTWEEITITNQWGENRIVNAKNIPIYDQNLMISTVVDVTERVQAQQSLIESNERYNLVSKATSDAIWDWDIINESIYFGEGFEIIFGHSSYELSLNLSNWAKYLHPEDKERVLDSLWKVIESPENNWVEEYRYKKADGQYAYVVDNGFVIRNSHGKGIRMVGAMHDISQKRKREQQLKLLESVIVNTKDSIIITEAEPIDEPGPRIIYVNEAFTKMTGYTAEEVIGKTPRILQGSNSDKKELAKLKVALQNWESCEVTLINYKKNGEEFWINFSVTPVADKTGWFTHWIAVERDITDQVNQQQKINSERNLLRTLIDSLPDTIYYKDKYAKKLISNKVDYQLLGAATEAEVLGKTDLEILPERLAEIGYQHDLEILKTGEPLINYEENFTTKEGKPLWLLSTKIALKNEKGEINGLLGIGRDITERKIALEKLKEANLELEKNVKQLLVSNAELEQFAYVASHDLQEPLRMVTSFLTLLEKRYRNLLDEKGQQYIYFAVDGAKRMRQIILDLLEYSRVGRVDTKAELVDMNELVSEILTIFRKQINEKKAIVFTENLPTILCSRSSLSHVLQNLISNCLKYSKDKKESPLTINISVKSDDSYWIFAVKDNGIGINPQFFDKIFIIFQRLHNKDEYTGTGVGLAITKKFIENLGGEIWVESEEGNGSTFYFTLPKISTI